MRYPRILPLQSVGHVVHCPTAGCTSYEIGVATALERNRTSHATSIHARLQADHIHSLTTAHQDTVATLSRELAAREHQLTLQSSELSKSRDSFRGLETRADRLEREKRELEQKWMEERSILEKKCVELEERLRHDREERLHRNRDADAAARHAQKRLLELEAQVADSELKVEVVNRDKKMLLEEVEKLRGKLKIIKQEADEKVAKAESDAEERWTRVIKDRVSKVDEKLKASEASRVKLEEEFDLAKTRWLAEKRSLQDKAMDTEARVRREEVSINNNSVVILTER
ncbi:hypothetical protein BC832DRAFT_83711 [Gaertneriomyces semiglobifer]|nr:hypothetical protein BC832DRAFT_83711 [Gaertneriomyces semiglobifer]